MAKLRWRWIPCPAYDLEGTEVWLQAMAARGWFLRRISFGFAGFARGAPRPTRYRLNATRGNVLDGDWDRPDSEECELSEAAGWYYVCPRGRFFLYACDDAQAPELHTDPAVQALQLKSIRSDACASLGSCLYFAFLHPLLWLHDKLFLMAARLPLYLLGFTAAACCGSLAALLRVLYLWGLTRRLRRGEAPARDERHRRRGIWLQGLQLAEIAVILLLMAALWGRWGEPKARPLSEYTAPLPFATLADLVGGGAVELKEEAAFADNKVSVQQTPATPAIYDFVQNAVVYRDGRAVLNATLFVDYYETRWTWLAKGVAHDLRAGWLRGEEADALSLPGLDEAWMTSGPYGQLLLRKGRRVMSVTYLTASDRDRTLTEVLPTLTAHFLR